MHAWHGPCGDQIKCTVKFGARRDTQSGNVACANNGSGWRCLLDSCTGAVILHGNGFAAGTSIERAAVRWAASRSTAHITFSLSAVGGATNTHESSRANTAALHERFISRISRRLSLLCSIRNYTEVRNMGRYRITALRTATIARGEISSVTARDVCFTCNQNINSRFLSDWHEIRRQLGFPTISSRGARRDGVKCKRERLW